MNKTSKWKAFDYDRQVWVGGLTAVKLLQEQQSDRFEFMKATGRVEFEAKTGKDWDDEYTNCLVALAEIEGELDRVGA